MSDSGTKKLSPDQHREIAAAQIGVVHIAIVTVSDSRTPETDTNAQYLRPAIEALGHVVSGYRLIKDEPDQVAAVLDRFRCLGCAPDSVQWRNRNRPARHDLRRSGAH